MNQCGEREKKPNTMMMAHFPFHHQHFFWDGCRCHVPNLGGEDCCHCVVVDLSCEGRCVWCLVHNVCNSTSTRKKKKHHSNIVCFFVSAPTSATSYHTLFLFKIRDVEQDVVLIIKLNTVVVMVVTFFPIQNNNPLMIITMLQDLAICGTRIPLTITAHPDLPRELWHAVVVCGEGDLIICNNRLELPILCTEQPQGAQEGGWEEGEEWWWWGHKCRSLLWLRDQKQCNTSSRNTSKRFEEHFSLLLDLSVHFCFLCVFFVRVVMML